MPKTSHRDRQGKVVLRRVPVLFRYRFYAEMSHWDEKKPTRYRTKAGPEVVLRKVSVLFAISSMPKRAIGRRTESFSERTILFALNLLCQKRAIEQTGQSRFEKGTRPFSL